MTESADQAHGTLIGTGPQAAAVADPLERTEPVGDPRASNSSFDDPDEIDLVGTTLLGRYSILSRLGKGGMGTVYLGEHTTIRKKFAIKVLSRTYAHKPDLVQRFLQEARAASMISQQNVVEITDFGETPTKSVFFVMEYLDGEDLSTTIDECNALPWERVQTIMVQICRALQAAHDAGIVHRDMKPENCFRIRRGRNDDFIKVLDFGIAKVTGENSAKGLTQTGMIFGTPEYMSPEQAKGEKADHRVDIYAAGVILYELLTGVVPFTADTFMGILTKHMFEVPKAPSLVAPPGTVIPAEVEAIILKSLQKDRGLRFQSMSEMAAALEAVGTGAGSVDVVCEDIVLPVRGQIGFQGGTTGDFAAVEADTSRTKLFVIGGLVAVGVAAGAFIGLRGGDEAKAEPAPVAVVDTGPESKPAEPEPKRTPIPAVVGPVAEEELKRPQVGTPTVTLKLETNVEAKIYDAVDDAVYGLTNGPEGVALEKSTEELNLVLRADGYEDLEMKIVPNRNKKWNKTLKKVKKRGGKPGKPKPDAGKEPGADPDPDPAEQPKPQPTVSEKPPEAPKPDEPKPKPNVRNGDLKNPFD